MNRPAFKLGQIAMRENIRALYYPDFFVDHRTLVREILLFDELHFMDRPSIMFGFATGSQYGTIGAASPLRQFEKSFQESGIPFFVHEPYSGPIPSDWYEKVKADINDTAFLRAFQKGLAESNHFRGHFIQKGNYGEVGNEADVLAALLSVNLNDLQNYGGATALFEDTNVRHMDLLSIGGRIKHLVSTAAICSAKLNFALDVGAKEGFSPLADADSYGELLGTKYRRAAKALEATPGKIELTDLSFAVLDELLSKERIETLSMKEAVDYRKASNEARRAFMDHISLLQKKQGQIAPTSDYAMEIRKIVETEVIPAVHDYRNALKKIDDSLVGSIAKGAVGAVGGSSLINVLGDMSLATMLPLAAAATAYVANALIDSIIARRAVERECSLSYILSLE